MTHHSRIAVALSLFATILAEVDQVAAQNQASEAQVQVSQVQRVQIPFQPDGQVNIHSELSSRIDLQEYSRRPNNFRAVLGNVSIARTIRTDRYADSVASAQVATFDATRLASITPFSIASSGPMYEFSNTNVRPISRRKSRTGPEVFLTFASETPGELTVLVVNEETGEVYGWSNTGNQRSLITPALDAQGKPIVGQSVVMRLKQNAQGDATGEDSQSEFPPDTGDVGIADGGEDEVSDDEADENGLFEADAGSLPINIGKPLTIYAAYTDKAYDAAMEHYLNVAFLIESQAPALEYLLNSAQIHISVPNPIVEKSGIDEGDSNSASLGELVKKLATSDDEHSVAFRNRRAELEADIAILVVHRDSITNCGHTLDIHPPTERAFAVVNWQCIAASYSYMHEVGHILGGAHQSPGGDDTDPQFARAFVREGGETPFVTVMGYRQGCSGIFCARRDVFSNPNLAYRDEPVGNAQTADNARVIRTNISDVVEYGERYRQQILGQADPGNGSGEPVTPSAGTGDIWLDLETEDADSTDRRTLELRRCQVQVASHEFTDARCAARDSSRCNSLALQLFYAAEGLYEARTTIDGASGVAAARRLMGRRDFAYRARSITRTAATSAEAQNEQFTAEFRRYFVIVRDIAPELDLLSRTQIDFVADAYRKRRYEGQFSRFAIRSGPQIARDPSLLAEPDSQRND